MFETFAIWLVTVVLDIAGGSALGAALIVAATYAIPVALSMAATRLLAPKMPTYADLAGRGVMTRNPVAPRQIVYGQTKCSGPIVYLATSGSKNQFLHIVVAVAGHQVEEIGDVYFNEDLVLTGAGDGYGTGIFSNCLIHKKLGTTTQTVDTVLEADFPTEWDSTHRLRGIAYVYCKLTYSAEVFPGGIPNISAVVKGKLVYNLATSTTVYSANPAYCLRDYLTDTDLGMGMTTAEIDDTACAAAATVCDGTVAHLPSGTEARYECSGQAVTSSTPDAIIGQLLSSMAGNIAYSGGKVVMYAGAYRTPTVTLTEAHLAGAVSVTTRASARDRVNAVKGTYISAANQWTAADFPSRYSSTYTAEDNGITHWRDVVLPFTTSSSAAQRIAVINLRQARQEIIFSARFNLNAMQLRAGDTVMITNAKFGWTAKVFEVIDWSLANEGTPPQPVIAMTLRETDSTVYAWDVGDEIAVEAAPNTDLPDPFTVPTPVVTLLSDSTTVIVQPDGTILPRLKVSWTTPNDIHVESGGFAEIEYKLSSDADSLYVPWATPRGDALFDYVTDVKVGLQYSIRVRFRNDAGVRGSYDTETSAAIVGDTTAPNAVGSSISATAFPGYIDLLWTPSTSATVNEYFIYRSITSAFAGFTLLAQTANSQYQDASVTNGTPYWYYVVAQSRSGIDSSASTVVNAAAIFAPNGVVPSNPTAPAQPGSPVVGTYDASDGSVFAFVTLTIAALPSGGVWQNLLYRRTGSSDWMVAAQFKNTGSTTMRLDDLSPGVGYDIAMQAWNGAGGSSVVTGTAFTAATKTSAPPTYSGASLIRNEKVPPNFTSSKVRRYGFGFFWAEAMGDSYAYPADFAYWEVKCVATTNSSATDYNWDNGSGTPALYRVTEPFIYFYRDSQQNYNIYVRAVNKSGVPASTWYDNTGNLGAGVTKPGGEMMEQEASAVTITGGTVSGITDIALADGGTGASTAANARTNLGVTATGSDTTYAYRANNLSDLASVSTARTNLGVTATGADTTYNYRANNLSDVASASTARSNLGFRAAISHVEPVLGGAPTESFSYAHNFGVLQDRILIQAVAVSSGSLTIDEYLVQHDYANAGNDTNTSYFLISTKSGTNLTNQSIRVTINWLP
jgi:hypothetical protein